MGVGKYQWTSPSEDTAMTLCNGWWCPSGKGHSEAWVGRIQQSGYEDTGSYIFSGLR